MNFEGLHIFTTTSSTLVSRILLQDIISLLASQGVEVSQDSLALHGTYERLSIEHARELRQKIREVVQGSVIILAIDRLPEDSQQPLLKIFEELPRGMSVLLMVPPSVSILPTVHSRAIGKYAISHQEEHEDFSQKNLEALHKKDPEAYKHTLTSYGKGILERIITADTVPAEGRSKLYKHTLKMVKRIPMARSAKMIGDYLALIDRFFK